MTARKCCNGEFSCCVPVATVQSSSGHSHHLRTYLYQSSSMVRMYFVSEPALNASHSNEQSCYSKVKVWTVRSAILLSHDRGHPGMQRCSHISQVFKRLSLCLLELTTRYDAAMTRPAEAMVSSKVSIFRCAGFHWPAHAAESLSLGLNRSLQLDGTSCYTRCAW
jgi:hypothetical protein